jgi:hypothetical protein
MIICYGNNICLFQGQEKEYQDKINEDAKELDKMTNKQSLLLKKVCLIGINKVCLTGIKKTANVTTMWTLINQNFVYNFGKKWYNLEK